MAKLSFFITRLDPLQLILNLSVVNLTCNLRKQRVWKKQGRREVLKRLGLNYAHTDRRIRLPVAKSVLSSKSTLMMLCLICRTCEKGRGRRGEGGGERGERSDKDDPCYSNNVRDREGEGEEETRREGLWEAPVHHRRTCPFLREKLYPLQDQKFEP